MQLSGWKKAIKYFRQYWDESLEDFGGIFKTIPHIANQLRMVSTLCETEKLWTPKILLLDRQNISMEFFGELKQLILTKAVGFQEIDVSKLCSYLSFENLFPSFWLWCGLCNIYYSGTLTSTDSNPWQQQILPYTSTGIISYFLYKNLLKMWNILAKYLVRCIVQNSSPSVCFLNYFGRRRTQTIMSLETFRDEKLVKLLLNGKYWTVPIIHELILQISFN